MEYKKERIKDFPEYMIDTNGVVYNKNGTPKKFSVNPRGYALVTFLKNGKQIRITYNKNNHDYCEDDGWWSEELWCYDNNLDLFNFLFKNIYAAIPPKKAPLTAIPTAVVIVLLNTFIAK